MSYLVTDDLLDHINNLPDWYVQVLEDREKPECDVCPDDWIEITLEDFDGAPITGEPYFVFTEHTQGSAITDPTPEGGALTNGAGQTTPTRLNLSMGSEIVDIAFGPETVRTLNLTDDNLGEEYDEQLYIIDTPVTYEGPLNFPANLPGMLPLVGDILNEINAAEAADVPPGAIADMLGELDVAMRAAAGIYSDLSMTARNDAEANLMLAMQGCPANYHQHPEVAPIYAEVDSIFGNIVPGAFIGPDGVPYGDPHVARWKMPMDDETLNWATLASFLDLIGSMAMHRLMEAETGPSLYQRTKSIIASVLTALGNALVSPAEAQQRIGGSRGMGLRNLRLVRRGKGSNPKRNPGSRNGPQAHAQASTRKPARSKNAVRVNGAKFKVREAIDHFTKPGGAKKGGILDGGHTTVSHAENIRISSARALPTVPHSSTQYGRGIVYAPYQPRRPANSRDGSRNPLGGQFREAQPKTVVNLAQRPMNRVLSDMKQALRNGMTGKKFKPNAPYQTIDAVTNTGIQMRFHISGHRNGQYTVRSFYYVIP